MKKTILVLGLLVIAAMVLAACQPAAPTPETIVETVIETVVVEKEGETIIETVVVEKEVEVPVEAEMPAEPMPDTLVACLGQQPDTLYQYGGSMAAATNVYEAIYDGPVSGIDANTYAYEPVIFDKLPSLADGDAALVAVTVAEGDSVVDDIGEVVVLDAAADPPQMIRPAGCASSDCAVAYAGGELEMDQLSATFVMFEGLLWSDGTPLTAADSVYSFNLQADPDTPTGKYVIERTASYEALDDVTIVWTGLPGYKDATYFVNFYGPSPEHVWGQYTAAELVEVVDAEALYVGWGPYIIDEWVKGDRISLHKNPNYFRADEGLPKFENLIYRIVGENSNANIAAILSGECDIVDQTSHLDDQSELLLELQAAGQVNPTFVTGTVWEHADFNITPLPGTGFAGWDTDGDGLGPFGDIRLRQAVAMCMDRQAVVDTVMFGQSIVLDTYIPPEHPLFADDVTHWDFDVDAASALLDEIGWLDDDGDPATPRVASGVTGVPDGTLLEFSYGTTSATQRMQATQVMGESMALCGMKVNLEYYPAAEWFADGPEGALFGRRTDLGQFAWLSGVEPSCNLYQTENIPGDPTEINPYTGAPYTNGWGGQNQTGYSNPEFDAICNAALQSLPGQDAYYDNHVKAQEIFGAELPVVPLYLRLKLAATRPDFCNFIMDPTNTSEFWNIEVG
jgi:peptide/nickel transport system substrate-binding protein